MPNPDLERTLERVRQARATHGQHFDAEHLAAAAGAGDAADPFAPGTRAFDRVSGQEVEILGGTRENLVIPAPKR